MMASIGSVGKAMAGPWSCRGRGRRRPGRVAGVIGIAVGLAMALAACTSAQPSSTGSESQRAAISSVPGVTFLPFSTTHPAGVYLLALRNVLVSSSSAHSPQGVTQAGDPAAAAVMDPYYPRTAVCPLATLTARGPQACLW